MNVEITLQPMDRDTVGQVAHLEQACFVDPWSLRSLTQELSNPLAVYLVALQGDEVVGYAGMYQILDEGHITNIAVSPLYRRRGIARRLVSELVELCRKDRIASLTLEVRASNSGAISLYQRMGFQPVGRRPRYYQHPEEDALLMTRFLTEGDIRVEDIGH